MTNLVERLRYLSRWAKVSPSDAAVLREAADYLEENGYEEEETNAVPN